MFENSGTKRVFFAEGDALNHSTERMLQILEHLHYRFPILDRVFCFSMLSNILQKKDEELAELRNVGLKMLHVGIDSGCDIVLRKVTKGATYTSIIQTCEKANRQGFFTFVHDNFWT